MQTEVDNSTLEVEQTIEQEVETSTPDENASVVSESTEGEQIETPIYEPVLTYNFRKEQRQIPEVFKTIIKDEETNNMVKSLYEKADGLDFMKERRDQARAELEQYRSQHQPNIQKFEDYKHFIQKGDISSARRVLGITDEQIAEEAIRLIEAQQNPQSNQQNEYAIQLREQERQNQMLQNELAIQNQTRANYEYDMATSTVAPIINAYESKWGADTFKTMVAQYGHQQEQMGRKLNISDAVNEVIDRYNLGTYSTPSMPEPTPQVTPTAEVKQFPKIVNSGSNVSNVAKNVQTYDDLVKLSNSI